MYIKRDEEGDITNCTYRTQTLYGEAKLEVRTAVFRQLMMLFFFFFFFPKRDLRNVDLFKVNKYIV